MLDDTIDNKLIITMGSAGARYNGIIYPVPEVEIKDTSGAGDTFIASLAAKYVNTNSVEESIQYANECATKVVQKKGVSII